MRRKLLAGNRLLTRVLGIDAVYKMIVRGEYDPSTGNMSEDVVTNTPIKVRVRNPEETEFGDLIKRGDLIATTYEDYLTTPQVGGYLVVDGNEYRIKSSTKMLHAGGNIGYRMVVSRGAT